MSLTDRVRGAMDHLRHPRGLRRPDHANEHDPHDDPDDAIDNLDSSHFLDTWGEG